MTWLPFERYELTSLLTVTEITKRVKGTDKDDYVATLSGNSILVQAHTGFKLGGYSRSFKPEAVINVNQIAKGVKLTVIIRPKAGAVAVLFLVTMLLFAATWFSQRNNIALGNYKDTLIVGVGLLVLSYLLPVSAFNNDIDHLKSFIAEIFDAADEI